MFKILFAYFVLFSPLCYSEPVREIAITMDDLPFVASKMGRPTDRQRSQERFSGIVQNFIKYKVPVTGFVIAGAIEKGQWDFLEQFVNAGLSLGNHTYSHYNLNTTNADKYIGDIDKADKILAPILSTPKYFRYPYLAEGNKQTKQKVLNYLHTHNYIVAPVTIDSKDFAFNERIYKIPFHLRETYIQKLKPQYLAYIWQQTLRAEQKANQPGAKQILLIHANLLNSYLLGDILAMYQNNGYKFISLTDALKKPAPTLTFPAPDINQSP